MRELVRKLLEAKGYSHIVLVKENQNYMYFEGATPEGRDCEIRLDKFDNTVWDRTSIFWDHIGEVS